MGVLTTTLHLPGRTGGPDDGAPESEVRRELTFYWDDHELVSPAPWRRWAIERRNQRRLRAALEEIEPDVVSVWNMGAMSLGLLTTVHEAGIPMVLVVCDDWLVYGPRLDAWTRLFVDHGRRARLARRLTGLPTGPPDLDQVGPACFVSDFTRRRAREWSRWSVPQSTVVYSGIDPADFPPDREVSRGEWDWRVLFVGRLDERKGVETLLRAIALLPAAATLDVVGPGPDAYLMRLGQLVAELGLEGRVRFRQLPRAELGAVYAAADVFVFPSEWDEPFGLVPIEAMACGTPVVATGTGGSSEFLADGVNCLRYPAGDAVALAATIERLAADSVLRARLVAAGRTTATDLSVDRLADELEAWHLAAAQGFADGEPLPRRLLVHPSVHP